MIATKCQSLINLSQKSGVVHTGGFRKVYMPTQPNTQVVKVELIKQTKSYAGFVPDIEEIIEVIQVSSNVFQPIIKGNKLSYDAPKVKEEMIDGEHCFVYLEELIPEFRSTFPLIDLCSTFLYKIENLVEWYQFILDLDYLEQKEFILETLVELEFKNAYTVLNLINNTIHLTPVVTELITGIRKYFELTNCFPDLTGHHNIFINIDNPKNPHLVVTSSATKAFFDFNRLIFINSQFSTNHKRGITLNFLESAIWTNLLCIFVDEPPVYELDHILAAL